VAEPFAFEEPQLQHVRGVEALDPEHRTGRGGCGTGGYESHELRAGDLHAVGSRLLFHPRHDVVQGGCFVVLDVHAHLCAADPWQENAERAHTRKPPVTLPNDGGDRARDLHIVRREVHVEGDQRPTCTDDHASSGRVEAVGPEIWLQLAVVDPTLQLLRAASSVERRPTARRTVTVEKYGQPQLRADPVRHPQRTVTRTLAILLIERHDRNDVCRADPRMRADVLPEVDALACARNAGQQCLDERLFLRDKREHGPVVIRIGVEIENIGMPCQLVADRVDRPAVPPFREVRHRLERQLHARTLRSVKAYYDQRAPEYDDWWLGRGLYADRDRPGWNEELRELEDVIADLPPKRTLDVACGTGFLTRHLRGQVVGLDASERMLKLAREQAPAAEFVTGDALSLPFADGTFERVFASYFYCHLEEDERTRFLAEARRVALELVIVASVHRNDKLPVRWEERRLKDGSTWTVYKRVFTGERLAAELKGSVLFEGSWFVVVRA
jgi:ubiquinone/menaquinone biosynthesis C-methylase UbiE